MTNHRRLLAGSILSLFPVVAACFANSSGGAGPSVDFDAGDQDSSFDATSPEEAGEDATVDAAPEASQPPPEAAAEASVEAATDAGVVAEAASEASTPGEAGVCAPLSTDGGACNSVTELGAMISATCINAPLPTQTGGTVVDGTYVISSVVAYEGTCPDAAAPTGAFFAGTLVFSGGCTQAVLQSWDSSSDGGIATVTYLGGYAGNQGTITTLCNSANPGAVEAGVQTVTYTATPTQVSLEFTGGPFPYVETYTNVAALGAPDAGIPDGACNTISLTGVPGGTLVNSTAALPAATGGVISDGTYYVTLATNYEQDAGSVLTGGPAGVWIISGGGTHLETDLGGSFGASANYTLFPLDSGATSIGVTATCGDGMTTSISGSWPYSVTTGDAGVQLSIIPNSQGLTWVTYTMQ